MIANIILKRCGKLLNQLSIPLGSNSVCILYSIQFSYCCSKLAKTQYEFELQKSLQILKTDINDPAHVVVVVEVVALVSVVVALVEVEDVRVVAEVLVAVVPVIAVVVVVLKVGSSGSSSNIRRSSNSSSSSSSRRRTCSNNIIQT